MGNTGRLLVHIRSNNSPHFTYVRDHPQMRSETEKHRSLDIRDSALAFVYTVFVYSEGCSRFQAIHKTNYQFVTINRIVKCDAQRIENSHDPKVLPIDRKHPTSARNCALPRNTNTHHTHRTDTRLVIIGAKWLLALIFVGLRDG